MAQLLPLQLRHTSRRGLAKAALQLAMQHQQRMALGKSWAACEETRKEAWSVLDRAQQAHTNALQCSSGVKSACKHKKDSDAEVCI